LLRQVLTRKYSTITILAIGGKATSRTDKNVVRMPSAPRIEPATPRIRGHHVSDLDGAARLSRDVLDRRLETADAGTAAK
jgi:hypothetical protein